MNMAASVMWLFCTQVEWENGDLQYCMFSQGCIHGLSKTFDKSFSLIHVSSKKNRRNKGLYP
jgi:hypothetical protein